MISCSASSGRLLSLRATSASSRHLSATIPIGGGPGGESIAATTARRFSGAAAASTAASRRDRLFDPSLTPLTERLSQMRIEWLRPSMGQRRPMSDAASSSSREERSSPPGEPITFLRLNNLADNPGARPKGRRIGRGIGSSKGKTCGRGHKGQKSRSGGGVHPTFEGGQTKLYKRFPKRGMKNAAFKLELVPLNIGRIQEYVTMGRLVSSRSDGVLTLVDFVQAGIFPSSSVKSGVKLLGGGKERVKDPLLLEVSFASESAIEAVEASGGYVTTVHWNRLALRAHLKPHKFPLKPIAASDAVSDDTNDNTDGDDRRSGGDGETATMVAFGKEEDGLDVHDNHLLPKRARPPPKYMEYYTDYQKRGYLNPKVQLERKQRGLKDIL